MYLPPKNGILQLKQGKMEYVRFGHGKKQLIMIPGLGDGLRSMKGTALPLALYYRQFSEKYTVHIFARKTPLSAGASTRDMAGDLKEAMELLGIRKADILGVSMGGMIAQHLAIDWPERVEKLVLVVTCARPNPIILESLEEWTGFARRGDHPGLMDSNLRRIYSDKYYRQNKWMIPLIGRLTKPKSYDRFLVMAESCATHDAFDWLGSITAPTLVLGGEQDISLGGDASRELAERIPGARLKMYPQWGHGLYEEAPDFLETVTDFLKEKNLENS